MARQNTQISHAWPNELAISRVRNIGTDTMKRERVVAASCYQNRPDRARRLHGGVGPPD